MGKFILIDKYNKEYNFNNISDLLKFGESTSSPIFMKLSLDTNINQLAYHFLQLEYAFIYIDSNNINIYFGDRIDSNRLDYIKSLIDNKNIIVKYNFRMYDGMVFCKEIIGNDFDKLLNNLK